MAGMKMGEGAGLSERAKARAWPLGGLLGYALKRASAAMLADFSAMPPLADIRPTRFVALRMITEHPGLTASELGRRLAIQRANMVPLLGELEGNGWIVRKAVPGDRRAAALSLTTAGKTLMAALDDAVARHEARFTDLMTEDELTLLHDLLDRIQSAGHP